MAILKCKMCGGDLHVTEGVSVCECDYCGTKQTVPIVNDEKKLTLFARANRLRLGCEFDKAAGVYESIVADFPEEAEAYWGLVLCRYGIEYVDDPKTGKKIPTCHRSSFDSVMEDNNFELTLEYADPIARSVYREEAKQIEELRRGIIAVSSKEEPYDIFICYKETDEKGDRTIDSVIAQDVYTALTEKGYRVFFSRITLEDKLGVEYEPYIFAALHSAKVMLVFGTNYEYYNAVWVKNEWSRFLQLIAKGEKKLLIPCYKDIDAYDMPKEFAKLQAQDMGKVGALQDLLRGVDKIMKSRSHSDASIDSIQQQVLDLVESDRQKAKIKKRRTIFTVISVILLGLLGYFVLYPWFASLNGNYAVYINMYNVEDFTVPQNATQIQHQTFANCSTLRSVTIPDSVTTIGNGAFLNCYNLTNVTIGNGVTEFGTDIFSGCDRLTTATVNSNIPGNLLSGTTVTDVTLGDHVTTIADNALANCQKLEKLTIGSGVIEFGSLLFDGCTSLTTVSINSDIPTGLFQSTTIKNLTIGDQVNRIGSSAFGDCMYLTDVSMGENVEHIGFYAFRACTSLTTISLNKGLLTLSSHAFYECTSLTSVTIPNNVTTIGYSAFAQCNNLTLVTIPNSVTSIEDWAFANCAKLTDVYFAGSIAQWQQFNVYFGHDVTVHCSYGTYTDD